MGASGRNKDVVVLCSTGQVAYPAAFFGIIAAGGIASLASASGTSYELARQIRQGQSKFLIVSDDMIEVGRDAAAQITDYKVTILVLRSDPAFSLQLDGEGDEGELRGQRLEDRLKWEKITDPEELRSSVITPVVQTLHSSAFLIESAHRRGLTYPIAGSIRIA